jgi:hypothetical protein
MNTESKAKELIEKFMDYAYVPWHGGADEMPQEEAAKQCALIALDEILTSKASAYPNQEIENGQVFKEYWEEVKQKIKQL